MVNSHNHKGGSLQNETALPREQGLTEYGEGAKDEQRVPEAKEQPPEELCDLTLASLNITRS